MVRSQGLVPAGSFVLAKDRFTPDRAVWATAGNGRNGASSAIRRVVSHRLQSAESGRLRHRDRTGRVALRPPFAARETLAALVGYLSSQTSSMRQPLKTLLTMMVSPLTSGFIWPVAEFLYDVAGTRPVLLHIRIIAGQHLQQLEWHAPSAFGRRLHRPADLGLTFAENVDEGLAVQCQGHRASEIRIVKGRRVPVDRKVAGAVRRPELADRLRQLALDVPEEGDRHIIGEGHIELSGDETQDRCRAVWYDRVFEFLRGRAEIEAFLTRKWRRELDYRLIKEIWTFQDNRIAVRFAYECHDDSGNWFRSYGNENWEFDENGLMRLRIASINDLPIKESERRYHWPLGRRPDDHPSLSDLEF